MPQPSMLSIDCDRSCENYLRTTGCEHRPDSSFGPKPWLCGQVCPASNEHSMCSHNLLPTLLHDDGCNQQKCSRRGLAGARKGAANGLQHMCSCCICFRDQLLVTKDPPLLAETASRDDCWRVHRRVRACKRQSALMQQTLRTRPRRSHGSHRRERRKCTGDLLRPHTSSILCTKQVEQLGIATGEAVCDVLRKSADHNVKRCTSTTCGWVVFDRVDTSRVWHPLREILFPEAPIPVRGVTTSTPLHADRSRKNEWRHCREGASAGTIHLLHHFDATHRRMLQRLGKGSRNALCSSCEAELKTTRSAAQVHINQNRGGAIAQDSVHVRMYGVPQAKQHVD
mmetsp:Transcript_135808/g.434482  ORF Transcript_135808/g.434482 Transcript_135808/m.434482 type:complete len:340 (-) Transcript_135808:4599-5618(-)